MATAYRTKQKSMIHESHSLGESYSDIRAPAGTPRFYSVTECLKCESEIIEHPAGLFIDDELLMPCEEADVALTVPAPASDDAEVGG